MLEPHTPEIRRELAAVRVAGLRHSARAANAGPVRRRLGNAFVRFGLRLGSDGSVPPVAMRAESLEEVPAGASSALLSARRSPRAAGFPTFEDFERELAAPYGLRVSPVSRTGARFGSRPGAPSARSRESRRGARFDAR